MGQDHGVVLAPKTPNVHIKKNKTKSNTVNKLTTSTRHRKNDENNNLPFLNGKLMTKDSNNFSQNDSISKNKLGSILGQNTFKYTTPCAITKRVPLGGKDTNVKSGKKTLNVKGEFSVFKSTIESDNINNKIQSNIIEKSNEGSEKIRRRRKSVTPKQKPNVQKIQSSFSNLFIETPKNKTKNEIYNDKNQSKIINSVGSYSDYSNYSNYSGIDNENQNDNFDYKQNIKQQDSLKFSSEISSEICPEICPEIYPEIYPEIEYAPLPVEELDFVPSDYDILDLKLQDLPKSVCETLQNDGTEDTETLYNDLQTYFDSDNDFLPIVPEGSLPNGVHSAGLNRTPKTDTEKKHDTYRKRSVVPSYMAPTVSALAKHR